LDDLRPLTGSASAATVSCLLGHADVRITQEVYAPLCGKFLAQEASKLGRHIGPALIREIPPVPELPKVGHAWFSRKPRQHNANKRHAQEPCWRTKQKIGVTSNSFEWS